MLTKNEISHKLYTVLLDEARTLRVIEARLGLGYVGIALSEKRLGLAAVLKEELRGGCTVLGQAGSLAGSRADRLLEMLMKGNNSIERAIGLATANAIANRIDQDKEEDTIALMNLTEKDKVAMVGLFRPLIPRIKATGAELSVIEKDPTLAPRMDEGEAARILEKCTVAIITATTLLNGTLEYILNSLGLPRHVTILGPSTPLLESIFKNTKINHIGGAVVKDYENALRIISEGGGTPALRPCLAFVNILRKENERGGKRS